MHIFYKDKDSFMYHCIFRQPPMFGYQERAVEFFKRMHNFAAMAMQYKCSLPREDKTLSWPRAPSRSTKQTGTASESMMAPSNLGFEVHHASHQRDITFLRKSRCRFVAKRIKRKTELEI
ncbi:hypothetical protein FRC03_010204 [Tulasnella sp. 419]|nr:hypothetical protein FRC03_010204 [Tulasnella sp. 419]